MREERVYASIRGVDLDTKEIRIRIEEEDLRKLAAVMMHGRTIAILPDPFGPAQRSGEEP